MGTCCGCNSLHSSTLTHKEEREGSELTALSHKDSSPKGSQIESTDSLQGNRASSAALKVEQSFKESESNSLQNSRKSFNVEASLSKESNASEFEQFVISSLDLKEKNKIFPCIDEDKSNGSIFGAFIGDSAGAYLEFSNIFEDRNEVIHALSLLGGGYHEIGPGQITDDSELAMSLAHALVEGGKNLDLKIICKHYGKWIGSQPFDVGHTIRTALFEIDTKNPDPYQVRRIVRDNNRQSLSNGSLMRITPLAAWCHRLQDSDLCKAVKEEVLLTHSNPIALDVAACYCLAIKKLIKYFHEKNRRQKTYQEVKRWANKNCCNEIKFWFKEIDNYKLIPCRITDGFVKIAFNYSMMFLKSDHNFMNSLYWMLMQGGDTDTNAAIVGGIIGAAVGFSNIPDKLSSKILSFDNDYGKNKRPDFLLPKYHLENLIQNIYDIAPKRLQILNGIKTDKSNKSPKKKTSPKKEESKKQTKNGTSHKKKDKKNSTIPTVVVEEEKKM